MLGNLLSAGVGLLGNLFNKSSQESSLQQQNLLAQQNMAMQREFAQQGIRWKVEDARAAGLNPLAALGANTVSFSPVSVGSTAPSMDLSGVGQDLGRAINAMKTNSERDEAIKEKMEKMTVEKASLENDLLRTQIRRLNSPGTGPGIPSMKKADAPIARTVSEGAPVTSDKIEQKAEDFPGTKVSRPFGYPLYANPYFGDAQSHEDRYGENEAASMFKWMVNQIADHGYTGYRWMHSRQNRHVKKGDVSYMYTGRR